jgi:hypothetical protein
MISEKELDGMIKYWEREVKYFKEQAHVGGITIMRAELVLKVLNYIKKGYFQCGGCYEKHDHTRLINVK